MDLWTRHRLRREALRIIDRAPDGLSVDALRTRLAERFPRAQARSIAATVAELDLRFAARVERQGGWLSRKPDGVQPAFLFNDTVKREQSVIPDGAKEEAYYAPLIAFIRGNIDSTYRFADVSRAPIGKDHWRNYNPDLIALSGHAATLGGLVQPELLAVEVKTSRKNPLDYLIQPLSYQVYAHRVILACPAPDEPNLKELLEARCAHFGVGLIYIGGKPAQGSFRARLQPGFRQPSLPALGEYLERLKTAKPELFAALTEPRQDGAGE